MTEERAGLPIRTFADATLWEAWLAQQPRESAGVWLKLAKTGNPEPSVTKPQAIDGALIHGWIDGQFNPYDARWWLIRFTRRKPPSKWSEKNRTRAIELIADGRIAAAGLREIDAAKTDGRWDAAYAPQSTATTPGARVFFDALDGTNRYAILHRLADAERPETRAARIAKFAAMCAVGDTLYSLRSARQKK